MKDFEYAKTFDEGLENRTAINHSFSVRERWASGSFLLEHQLSLNSFCRSDAISFAGDELHLRRKRQVT
ncbi:hypothetical protein Hypma_000577 [Hypsizygus marmoreus]|uniref:Uncharacterized protein n=1 Tax=Hypsizygus marmoreus TaxID=39966 RepID=A0A369J812_HYPMA|nr:hypothetical protein Hypma_000577 [Hypsizygus marmoreus]